MWLRRCLGQSTAVLPVALKEPASGTGRPSHQKPVGHTASTAVVVENGLYLRPHRAGHHVTPPAPGVGSCLRHLGHHVRKCQRGLSPHAWSPWMLWRSPSPPPLSWEDRVREEEDEEERHSSIGGDSQPCPSPACMEGCSISDVSMAEEGPQQGDSDVVVEEEVEESMEMDEPSNIDTPHSPYQIRLSCKVLRPKLRMTATAMRLRRVRTKTRPTTQTSMRTSFSGRRLTFPYPEGTLMTP